MNSTLRQTLVWVKVADILWNRTVVLSALIVIFSVPNCVLGQDTTTPIPQIPKIEKASNEGIDAIKAFEFPENLKCELFAAEPMVANIVAIHRDFQGRIFVAESFRQEKGIEDNRNHTHWMDDELAAKTVQDRIDYIRKYIPDAESLYTAQDDRIRMLRDANGDGTADSSVVFSDRYNRLEMGTGAGVLSYRNRVYFTCIPDLFELSDNDGDGVADVRKSLHSGFGVRFAFRGHDMHGLIVGPDGRLYFSIGDRGYNVNPSINDPTSGAVFRCELDGSHLQVVSTGLRNPQELAFDDFGNLFTGDNNSDSGDRARFTEILAGADSGWRMYYQYIHDRGPFNREKIWHPMNPDTPAYIVPPIANFADGPSGLEYYPGTGFGDEFKGRFFLCDFRGAADQSGIRSFRLVHEGAGWQLEQSEKPFWKMLITDLDFGSDGRLYVSDWVFGWQGVNKGRVYSFFDPQHVDSKIVNEVETLLRDGLARQKLKRLEELLGHADRRVRQEAQFELVARSEVDALRRIAHDRSCSRISRVHALWGMEQLFRYEKSSDSKSVYEPGLLDDPDWQVVAVAAKIAGELARGDVGKIAGLLRHENRRVRFQAAMALRALGTEDEVPLIAEMLVDNADRDPVLRHGGIMALNGIFKRSSNPGRSTVADLSKHSSPSVRIALTVAMRKLLQFSGPGHYPARLAAAKIVAERLGDADGDVVLEAARVIHDVPVDSEMGSLASLVSDVARYSNSQPLIRRLVSANYRIGTRAAAFALVDFSLDQRQDPQRRVEAIEALSHWANPPARDLVLHDWRPLDPRKRNVNDARNALESKFIELVGSFDSLSNAAIKAAGDLNLTAIEGKLAELTLSPSADDTSRRAALISLSKLGFKQIDMVLETLVTDFKALPPKTAAIVVDLVSILDEPQALELIRIVLAEGSLRSQQSVLATLGKMNEPASALELIRLVGQLASKDQTPELRLDVRLAAESREDEAVRNALKKYFDSVLNSKDPMSQFAGSLYGGDAQAGRRIFIGKTEVSCVRCHKIDGTGGEVGPVLIGIGKKKDRRYLLESIVRPNATISEGYAQTKVMTEDGKLHIGLIKSDTAKSLSMIDADGNKFVVEKDTIESTQLGKSSMPEDLIKNLTRRELRDLIEFLSSQ